MFLFNLETEILWTVSCSIVHLAFLTSYNLLFFSLYKTFKNNSFGFLSFFLGKLFQSRSLKLNISRTAQQILMILVSFCRILNGLSDVINLFWRCSSPSTLFEWAILKTLQYFYLGGHYAPPPNFVVYNSSIIIKI